MTLLILYALLIMVASLAGILFVWGVMGKLVQKHLAVFVSFAAGVFLAVVAALSYKVVAHASVPISGIVWILVGAMGIFLVFKFLPTFHHHHDEHHESEQHSRIDARKIITGDVIHNIGDGILLAAAFSVSVPLGIATATSVFIHEIVQEISEFFVLRQAGYSTGKALLINLAASSSILIGAIGGYLLLDTFSVLEMPLLGISAGAFLVIVIHDLIPESVRNSKKKKNYLAHSAAFIIGVTLMALVTLSLGHAHESGGDNHEHAHTSNDVHYESEHSYQNIEKDHDHEYTDGSHDITNEHETHDTKHINDSLDAY